VNEKQNWICLNKEKGDLINHLTNCFAYKKLSETPHRIFIRFSGKVVI